MLKRLSPYTDDQLAYLLARVREIAALGDEAALIETDKIVWEIFDEQIVIEEPEEVLIERSQGFYVNPRLRHVEYSLKSMQERFQRRTLGRWDLSRLQNDIRFIESDAWKGQEPLLAECNAFLNEAWQTLLSETFERCATWNFKNVSSVTSMVTELTDTIQMYSMHEPLAEEYSVKVRAIKERGARYRWNKKMSDAVVAKAAGFIGKAEGLRKEADAMLAQDWANIFPGETPTLPET